MRETRRQLKARLQSEGKREGFKTLREQFKREGLTPRQAHAEAMAQIESRPPQPAAANPSPVAEGEQNESNLSRLVIDIPHIEMAAWGLVCPTDRCARHFSGLFAGLAGC
jgi:hypothetical protein